MLKYLLSFILFPLVVLANCVTVDMSAWNQEQKNLAEAAAYTLVYEADNSNKPPERVNHDTGEICWTGNVFNLDTIITNATMEAKIDSILNVPIIPAPELLELEDETGKVYYFWVDQSGNLKGKGDLPTDFDAEGELIKDINPGAQL